VVESRLRDARPHELQDVELRVVERFRETLETGDPRATIDALVADEAPVMPARESEVVAARVQARVSGLGPLQPIVDDPAVTDVLINGSGPVWVERNGVVRPTAVTMSSEEVHQVVERILGPLGLRVDRANPIVDGRLADGSRIAVVGPPLSIDGLVVAIRRFSTSVIALETFASLDVVALVDQLVAARANLVVYGGTGSGKTTLLRAMADRLPAGERVVTIEDTAELCLPGEHIVQLEARPPNAEGVGEVTIRQLVRASLRLRPDRIVVGEVRGPEAFDMLWSMASGHDGSMSTCHANSAVDALARLETFVLTAALGLPLAAVRAQIRSAVDVLIGVERGAGGSRVVNSVSECVTEGDELAVTPLVVDGTVVAAPERSPRHRSAA
jgi:pilus assembly protein CpaF